MKFNYSKVLLNSGIFKEYLGIKAAARLQCLCYHFFPIFNSNGYSNNF